MREPGRWRVFFSSSHFLFAPPPFWAPRLGRVCASVRVWGVCRRERERERGACVFFFNCKTILFFNPLFSVSPLSTWSTARQQSARTRSLRLLHVEGRAACRKDAGGRVFDRKKRDDSRKEKPFPHALSPSRQRRLDLGDGLLVRRLDFLGDGKAGGGRERARPTAEREETARFAAPPSPPPFPPPPPLVSLVTSRFTQANQPRAAPTASAVAETTAVSLDAISEFFWLGG